MLGSKDGVAGELGAVRLCVRRIAIRFEIHAVADQPLDLELDRLDDVGVDQSCDLREHVHACPPRTLAMQGGEDGVREFG